MVSQFAKREKHLHPIKQEQIVNLGIVHEKDGIYEIFEGVVITKKVLLMYKRELFLSEGGGGTGRLAILENASPVWSIACMT